MFFGAVTSTDGLHFRGSRPKEVRSADSSIKLSLPIFGLASYKFKVSVWNPNGVYECQKVNSLLRAADNWLRLLQVNHPDYRFFLSHNSQRRWKESWNSSSIIWTCITSNHGKECKPEFQIVLLDMDCVEILYRIKFGSASSVLSKKCHTIIWLWDLWKVW